MRIAFAGYGRLGCALLENILKSSHEVVLVIQNGRTTKGWRRLAYPVMAQLLGGDRYVAGVARRHKLPVYYIDRMTEDELAPLRAYEPDLLLVGGFGIIIKPPLLRLPKIGCVNVHSSLLPKHRGPNPFTAVLLADEKESGVTFHVMEEGIDTGDILAQYAYPLNEKDTAASVFLKAAELAGQHVVGVLDRIEEEGELRGTPQDDTLASYEKKITVEESFLDWTMPAPVLERQVRACNPTMLARFVYRNRLVYVARTRVVHEPVAVPPGTVMRTSPRLCVATGEGGLEILVAWQSWPLPWLWPGIFSRPAVGEVLE